MRKSGIFLITIIILLLVIFLISPTIIAKTNSPSYCGSCHVMQEQYTAWVKGGLHNNIKCVDCHLPNDSRVKFYIWKAIDGGKDFVAFHTGAVPEKIQASSHSKKTIQSNCIRCHEGVVSKMLNAEGRHCWDCHKRISHKLTGLRETL